MGAPLNTGVPPIKGGPLIMGDLKRRGNKEDEDTHETPVEGHFGLLTGCNPLMGKGGQRGGPRALTSGTGAWRGAPEDSMGALVPAKEACEVWTGGPGAWKGPPEAERGAIGACARGVGSRMFACKRQERPTAALWKTLLGEGREAWTATTPQKKGSSSGKGPCNRQASGQKGGGARCSSTRLQIQQALTDGGSNSSNSTRIQ